VDEKQKNIALVTGASKGIGKAIAIELAKNGYFVIVNYNKNENYAKETCEEIKRLGGKAVMIKANVASEKEVNQMFKSIKREYNCLDVLVNNAGIVNDGLLTLMSKEKFDNVVGTNLGGCFNVTKAALLLMSSKKNMGGSIVNISSTSALSGQTGQSNYSASKGAIISFSKSIAKEYAHKNIRCNVICPGFIVTDMTKNNISKNKKEEYESLIPLRRFGTASEVAKAVSFLASNDSSYITGQVLTVDGGMIS
jgi:3-oxoacyl-[acyl-carrier protein] reductase